MGVHGLTSQLEQHVRPQVVTRLIEQPEAGPTVAKGDARTLLVDASAVAFRLVEQVERASLQLDADASWHAALYERTVAFYGGIKACGLKLVLVCDSGTPPGHEARMLSRRRQALKSGGTMLPTADLVMSQAYQDLGLQVERSIHCADKLLLAWYHRHASQVFAVLTNDSDFYVYGVNKIVHVEDVVVDRGSVTFHVWNVNEMWVRWQADVASRSGGAKRMYPLTLKRRANVAAVLGNDSGQEIRDRLTHRADQNRGSGGYNPTSMRAAKEVLLAPKEDLNQDFFRMDPLNIRNFDAADFEAFRAQVKEYLDDDAAARSGSALERLRVGPQSLPWLDPGLAERLGEHVAPGMLVSFAARGLSAGLAVPEQYWRPLHEVRRAVAQGLGTPGAVFEYCAATNTLHMLAPPPPDGAGRAFRAESAWFEPSRHLPLVPLVDETSASLPALQAGTRLPDTFRKMQSAYPKLPVTLLVFHAILLHAMRDDTDEHEAYGAAVRALLLPGVPMPDELEEQWARAQAAEEAAEEEEEATADGAAAGAAGVGSAGAVVPVGSQLTKKDWEDIDASEVVAKARSSTGFLLMNKLQPWDQSAVAAPQNLPFHELFQQFYALAQQDGRVGKFWGELLQACFPQQLADAKAGDKAAVKARHKELLALGGPQGKGPSDARFKGWMDRLKAFAEQPASAELLLAVRRDATQFGPDSKPWLAAKVCWAAAAAASKVQALADMWTCLNSGSHGGPPRRFPHQQALLDMVHEHLKALEKVQDAQDMARRRGSSVKVPTALPLHIIFSTPTGSGKTFTAVMMHIHMLRPRPEVASASAQYGEGHPEAIVLYSVPTKQILKKVGQDCEAHRVVYWTAAKDGDLYQIRRPYSIRSQRGGGATGLGSMVEQLETAEKNARKFNDIGGGTPAFIVADIHATAAILRAAQRASSDCWYHPSKLILYLDEPTMGIHLDASLLSVVKDIIRHAPFTSILASATLPNWEQLPRWWKGTGKAATRAVISQEPYGLPMSRLRVLDEAASTMTPISILQLFPDLAAFKQAMSLRPRLGVLLLRHLSSQQANQLLLDTPRPVVDTTVAESEGWEVMDQDVSNLRQSVGPKLQELDTERFDQLREQWAEPTRKIEQGWANVVSQKGVTMVATLDPRRIALEIAGKWKDPEGWDATIKDVRAKIKAAKSGQRALAKAEQRSQKKTADDVAPSQQQAVSSGVTLRRGLEVTVEQAEETEDDLLAMLAKGVAFAATNDSDPLVMRLYQQALLWIPERAFIQPSIHVLVVDYSSIYGTDCTSVDTIVMCKDLGEALSWEDHQQFIGRLRRDGIAIYPSLRLLRYATTGVAPSEADLRQALQQQVGEALTTAATSSDASSPPDPKDVRQRLESIRRGLDPAGDVPLTRGDVAACTLVAALSALLSDAGSAGMTPVALYQASVARLKQWGALKLPPLLRLQSPSEQAALVSGVETVGLPAAVAAKLLQWLYEEDVLSEEAVKKWWEKGAAAPVQTGAASAESGAAFREKVVKPFMEWLQEADEEEEDEEEDA